MLPLLIFIAECRDGLSEQEFGFREAYSTVDNIDAVFKLAIRVLQWTLSYGNTGPFNLKLIG